MTRQRTAVAEGQPSPANAMTETGSWRDDGFVIPKERPWPTWLIYTIQVGILAIVVALWELGVRIGWVSAFFWSSPAQIWSTGITFVAEGTALQDTWFTVRSTIIGFVVGTTSGAIIGLALWWSRNAAAIVEPYLVVFNAVPKLAFGPLLILIFGIGVASKIALAVALTIVVAALAAHAGVKSIDQDLVRMMYSLGARRWDIFIKIVIPTALPWIVSSLRVNIGFALTGALVGEFISSQYGLGKMILYAGSTYEMALVWVGIIILSLVAVLMFWAVRSLERVLLTGMHATNPN
jgi:NitT/TauT family transport system permease protein